MAAKSGFVSFYCSQADDAGHGEGKRAYSIFSDDARKTRCKQRRLSYKYGELRVEEV